MNIVKRLTLRHMGVNKGRTVVTVCGIAVSVAMITAVFVSIASFLNLYVKLDLFTSGKNNAECASVTQEQLSSLKNDERIETLGIEYRLSNTADGNDVYYLKSDSDDSDSEWVRFVDSGFMDMFITSGYEGELPKNDGEIAVEQSYIKQNHPDWCIGKIVTLDIEKDISAHDEDNSENEYVKAATVSGKITAILHNNPPTMPATILMHRSAPEKGEVMNVTFTLKNPDFRAYDTIDSIAEDNGVECEANVKSLRAIAYNPDDDIVNSMIVMTLILISIIIVASFMLIYNSFSMSLSERVKYLGMLASVGATKKQKRLSVYFEGLILGFIGIPLGIGAGIAGISITLSLVSKKIFDSGMMSYDLPEFQSIDVVVPLWSIIAIIIFSVITIYISLLIPSVKASRITPIDAIRKSSELKVKPRKLKTPRLVRKIFGFEGELAHKNIKRQGKRTRLITFSIALSVVLFLTVNFYCQSMLSFSSLQYNDSYQLAVSGTDKAKIEEILNGIKNIEYHNFTSKYVVILNDWDKDGTSQDGSINIDSESINPEFQNTLKKRLEIALVSLKDSDFNEMCKSNGIDYNKYYGKDNCGVLLNDISVGQNKTTKPFNEKMIGKVVESSAWVEKETTKYEYEQIPFELKITDFANYDSDKYYCRYVNPSQVAIFVPESVYFSRYDLSKDDTSYEYIIETKSHKDVYEAINSEIDSQQLSDMYCIDIAGQMQAVETTVFVLEVFVYGFIVLITLITVANIINTISTGIALRKREFAMLKSVGITPRGFRKSICLETLLIGIKALIFSVPISVLLSFLMYKAMSEDILMFEINWLLYLEVVLAVFLIIGVTMAYSVFKLRNDSIVGTLKNDLD